MTYCRHAFLAANTERLLMAVLAYSNWVRGRPQFRFQTVRSHSVLMYRCLLRYCELRFKSIDVIASALLTIVHYQKRILPISLKSITQNYWFLCFSTVYVSATVNMLDKYRRFKYFHLAFSLHHAIWVIYKVIGE